jgi:hypothetical protein
VHGTWTDDPSQRITIPFDVPLNGDGGLACPGVLSGITFNIALSPAKSKFEVHENRSEF